MADLGQCGRELRVRIVADALLERREDRFRRFVQPHAHDEREPEFPRIGGIGAFEAREVRVAQPVKPEAALFGFGVRRHRARARDLAGKLRMAAQEGKLLLARRDAHGLHHRVMQRSDRRKRPRRVGALRHPGRVLEDIADRRHEGCGVAGVQLVERDHGRIFASR